MTTADFAPPAPPEVEAQLIGWAAADDNVRGLLLTSSRADPQRTPDRFSDYDLQLFVRDLTPFTADDDWLTTFGTVMVRWPRTPQSTGRAGWITRLVQYQSGLRLDFQITAQALPAATDWDHGFRVLVDKDEWAARLPEPRHRAYLTKPPTADELADRLNAFWWDLPYVGKALWRGEPTFAHYMLEGPIRSEQLVPLLCWHAARRHKWRVNVGLHGRWLHRYLAPDLWAAFAATFVGGDEDAIWSAVFGMGDLVDRVGSELASAVGIAYPTDTAVQVTAYLRHMRQTAVE